MSNPPKVERILGFAKILGEHNCPFIGEKILKDDLLFFTPETLGMWLNNPNSSLGWKAPKDCSDEEMAHYFEVKESVIIASMMTENPEGFRFPNLPGKVIFKNPDHMREWMQTPHPEISGLKPESLWATEEGIAKVLSLVRAHAGCDD